MPGTSVNPERKRQRMVKTSQRRWLAMRGKSRDERIDLIAAYLRRHSKGTAPQGWYR